MPALNLPVCAGPQGHSLKLARKLLALPLPEIELALPYLIDSLQDGALATRESASALLVGLGRDAVPALLDAWDVEDLEFRRQLIVTLGQFGPQATAAVPLLRRARADRFLGASARQALVRIQPPVVGPFVEAMTSFWTWSRLLDLLLLVLAHPLTAVLSLLGTVLSFVHWYRELSSANGALAPAVSASFALLGASLGGIVGAKLWGFSGLKIGSKAWGICGSAIGLAVGSLATALVQPLALVLGR